jgi:membrane-bound lytic murein transglycosylase D
MMKNSRPKIALCALLSALTVGVSQAGQNKPLSAGLTLIAGAAVGNAAVMEVSGREEVSLAPTAVPVTGTEGTDGGVRSREADECLRRSDSHFNAGRQLYFEGDLAGARREFDQAVDALLRVPDSLPDHSRIERRLDEICNLIYRFDVEKLGAGQKADQEKDTFDEAPIDAISRMTFGVDEKLAPQLQSELSQVTSGIPLELAGPVPGLIRFFSTTDSGRRTLLAGFRRAGRYRALIQRILTEEGVPQELIYLAQAESGFLPRAVSNKKAVGMWQFIADTGTIYQLKRSGTYDERLDPEKATRAAARFLKFLHERYGDWYLAMAAYNCGAGAVDRAVERTGYADYWELLRRHSLPRETANYVPIIIAMTIIAKNPQDYGLDSIGTDAPLEYDSIRVTAATHLDLIADATLQPVSVIRDLNPSLLGRLAPIGFQVHVPKGTAAATQEALDTVPANSRHAWRLHHVSSGDTLAGIAKSYHLTPERIVAVNGSSDSMEAGDTLLIPALDPVVPVKVLKGRRFSKGRYSLARGQSSRSTMARRSGNVAASRRVSAHVSARVSSQALHRKAEISTASLRR